MAVCVFDDFDYVALGHIHGPQKVGRETVRYCGTPLKYSFSEVSHKKSVTVVEMGEKGSVGIRTVPLVPRRDMSEIRGTYNTLMLRENYEGKPFRNDYLHITLTDEEDIPNAVSNLRVVYPNLMRLDYDNARTRAGGIIEGADRAEQKPPLTLFGEFYESQNGTPMSEEQQAFADKLIASIWEEEKQKEDKFKKIQEFFDSCGDAPEWLQLNAIFDQRWLNATASMKSVQEAITGRITQINIDLATLAGLPEFGYEAQQVYQSTLDINKALAEGQRMAQIQKQKAEYEAEQARLKEEEEAKKAAFPADAMNPPAEEACDIPQEAFEDCRQNQKTEEKQWISFSALLSTEDALALKEFFGNRNIEFKAI